jgi:hypothetical protein
MPDYNNGKIYIVRFNKSNEIYIGSTTQSLAVRFGGHKRCKSSSVYKLINDKYNENWDECYYELYENHSCNSKEELSKKEGEIIRLFKNDENYDCINCRIAGRKQNEYNIEYRKNNLERERERDKIYYHNNKEKKSKAHKIWYENNKEKLKNTSSAVVSDCNKSNS